MKRAISFIIAICLAAAAFSGCAPSSPTQTVTPKVEEKKTEAKKTRTVVDHTGAMVEIPEKIERVVITSLWPLPSIYVLFMGSADKLVGMHPASLSAAKYSMLPKIAPEVDKVQTGFIKNGELNVEELMKINPDVVLYNASDAKEKEILNKAGIPAVGFSTSIEQFNTVETVNRWVELLGTVFKKEDRVKEITEYARKTSGDIQARLKDIPASEKPKALILFKYSDKQFQTSGSNFFGQYWLDTTGAINVASGLTGMSNINMEQVYEWNPDIIYITNFSGYMPEDLIANKGIDGHDWSGVKAIKDKKVYKFPLGMYRWFPPSSDSALCLWFLAKTNHPEKFEDVDLKAKTKEYYKKFYKIELTDQDVESVFNPAREAADGV